MVAYAPVNTLQAAQMPGTTPYAPVLPLPVVQINNPGGTGPPLAPTMTQQVVVLTGVPTAPVQPLPMSFVGAGTTKERANQPLPIVIVGTVT